MIGAPLNDVDCLAKVTEAVEEAVESEEVRDLAGRFETTCELAGWIRQLPQRNDTGNPDDGPRVLCDVSQRVRIPAGDPNCVERSALYLAAAEHVDPRPLRQLATIKTPFGRHTFPVEDDRPVKLDARMTRNALEAGLYRMSTPGVVRLSPAETMEWVLSVAAESAAEEPGGVDRLRNAARAIGDLWAGRRVRRNDAADIGFGFAVAEQAARMFGQQGLDLVHTGLTAIGELARRRAQRNLRVRVAKRPKRKRRRSPLERLARVGGRLGTTVASSVLRAKLASLGIPLAAVTEIERAMRKEGLSLGHLVGPEPLPGTLSALAVANLT